MAKAPAPTCTRKDVERITLNIVRGVENNNKIKMPTTFKSIGVTPAARKTYYIPLDIALSKNGCPMQNLQDGDFHAATSVQNLADMVCTDLNIK